MRVFRLLLLGALSFVISVLFLFPAAPVVDRVKPMLAPAEIAGVSGKVLKGSVAAVSYDDGILPLAAQNVEWRVLGRKLLTGAAGVDLSFDAYGGSGSGTVARQFNGDIVVNDFAFKGPAKGFEALMPLPLATFNGTLAADIESVEVKDQLLKTFRGTIDWTNALVETPVQARLGNVQIDVKPQENNAHKSFVTASGGEVDIEGTVDIALNGDFRANLLITPNADATPEVLSALRGLGRPDSSGRYRIQQNGNVNRLM